LLNGHIYKTRIDPWIPYRYRTHELQTRPN